ncbi:recombinase family protein [Falsiroseomonas sp. E2-1-a20]|uniref:recombinase family protein n=1 Tax=Falsiroseomonas sp. E2-1-a20 TaxID=3239300 RepID=UPI003F402558
MTAHTRESLFGCHFIGYERWSSPQQGEEGRSSESRQTEATDRIVVDFKLVPHPRYSSFRDAGFSASKGHHRTKGSFGDILRMAEAGDFRGDRPVVLIVEATDRLFREGLMGGLEPMSMLVNGNVVVVTGDGSIWDRSSLDGDSNHKFVAEMNAARRYATRLAEMAVGAHNKRRAKLLDPATALPRLNGRTPGWMVKRTSLSPEGFWHDLGENVWVIRRIFQECRDGATVKMIAAGLNRDGIPVLGDRASLWRATRVGAILADRHVLGFYTPTRWVPSTEPGKPSKRTKAGPEVRAYPAAIALEDWFAAREVLAGRQSLLRGRSGSSIPNLFTGRTYCGSCEGRLRAATGGRKVDGRRPRDLLCAAYVESGTCQDRTRYDMWSFEVALMNHITNLSTLAPRSPTANTSKLLAEKATALAEVDRQEQIMAALRPSLPQPWALDEMGKAGKAIDSAKRRATELALLAQHAATATDRRKETMAFMRTNIGPAVQGDVSARDMLRSLLTRVDFKIVGQGERGLVLTVGDVSVEVPHSEGAPQWREKEDA